MNETIVKFGYPQTLLAEYEHWVVLLRQKQVTAGSMVVACKAQAVALGDVSEEAWGEVARVTADLEAAARAVFGYDRINYLALMMVDPHVHFHVLPRHETPREIAGAVIADEAWPKPPDITRTADLTEDQLTAIADRLRASWPER